MTLNYCLTSQENIQHKFRIYLCFYWIVVEYLKNIERKNLISNCPKSYFSYFIIINDWLNIHIKKRYKVIGKLKINSKSTNISLYNEGGRHGGSMVAHQTVVLQSWVRIQCLPNPQLTANLLMGCHLGWHLAGGWPLWGAIEEKIMKNEPLVRQKHIKKKKIKNIYIYIYIYIYLYTMNSSGKNDFFSPTVYSMLSAIFFAWYFMQMGQYSSPWKISKLQCWGKLHVDPKGQAAFQIIVWILLHIFEPFLSLQLLCLLSHCSRPHETAPQRWQRWNRRRFRCLSQSPSARTSSIKLTTEQWRWHFILFAIASPFGV